MKGFLELEQLPERLFAVGDIHGCADELKVLLDFLGTSEGLTAQDQLLFIGDYVDRGAESNVVIEILIALKARFPRTIFLRGNHEDMLLSFLGLGGDEGAVYLVNGGASCLCSYGLDCDADDEPEPLVAEARKVIPPEHLAFFQALERYVVTPRHVLVHAGLNPLRDLHHQVDEDIFWIRGPFIHHHHHFDKTIIYGHTPSEDIALDLPWKVGIDTGLVYGNKLSCIELISGTLFQIARGKSRVKRRKLKG